ncbi:MAG: aromatic amino acid lyase, partial [Pseudomonadota bacterium]
MTEITLGGAPLTPADLAAIAEGAPVLCAPEGLRRMAEGRAVIDRAVAQNRPIYGVTTGLGPRVVDRLEGPAQAAFALSTVRGRAHAVGPPLPVAAVRAAMACRAHALLSGAVGVRPGLAELLAGCLNAGLSPVIGQTASIGAADLLWGGTMGLALIGEGSMETAQGVVPAAEALAAAGLTPWDPAPREGLALASHSSVSAGLAALGLARLDRLMAAASAASALSLEGFRGNLTPLDPDILALSPKPGEAAAAAAFWSWLEGTTLTEPAGSAGGPRRLQDPLSLRNLV